MNKSLSLILALGLSLNSFSLAHADDMDDLINASRGKASADAEATLKSAQDLESKIIELRQEIAIAEKANQQNSHDATIDLTISGISLVGTVAGLMYFQKMVHSGDMGQSISAAIESSMVALGGGSVTVVALGGGVYHRIKIDGKKVQALDAQLADTQSKLEMEIALLKNEK